VAQALARGDAAVEVFSRDGATKLATGTLAVLDNQVNQTTATLRLKALVPNPGRVLWPNAFVKARLLVDTRKDALIVPTVAVQHGPQGTFVYTVGADKTAQMAPVTVALTTGDLAVIGKGLSGGEQVIVEGQNQVRPGGRVEPARRGGPPAAPGAPGQRPDTGKGSGSNAAPGGSERRGNPSADAEAAPAAGSAASRPAGGQPRPRGPATGPTATNQPAIP
jgi:multidrug efflux system membrane fusion protein